MISQYLSLNFLIFLFVSALELFLYAPSTKQNGFPKEAAFAKVSGAILLLLGVALGVASVIL